MGADNWTTCPKCEVKFRKEQQKALEEADAAYGRVPVSKYLQMLEAARIKERQVIDSFFREDYEIGIEGFEFTVTYRGRCTHCDFTYSFNFQKDLSTGRK